MAMRDYRNDKFEIGQEVYLRYGNNRARGGNRDKYDKAYVIKIGRKYITVGWNKDSEKGFQIDLESGYEKTIYSPDYNLYLSEQELLDEIELEKKLSKIRTKLGSWGDSDLTIDQVRKIYDIIYN